MALVPKIDKPCPLGIDELRRLSGYCGHCDKHVHALDGLNEPQRRALLQAAEGPICVSYRVPRAVPVRRGAGFGIAIAATLVSGGAFAADPPSLLAPTTAESATSPVAAAPLLPVAATAEGEEETKLEFIAVVGGGVSDPQDAQWIDDSDLPELPMRDAASVESTPTDANVDVVARPIR